MTTRRPIACVLVCSLTVAASGCTSTKTIHPATQPGVATFGPLEVGDDVVVETTDHKRVRIKVRELTDDTIVSSSGARYGRADIERIKRRSFSATKTAILVGGIVAGWYIIASIIVSGLRY